MSTSTSWLPRGSTVVLAICAAVVVPAVLLVALASRPLDLARIEAQQTPLSWVGERPGRSGCGLNEVRDGDRCAPAVTTFTSHAVTFPSSHPERGVERLAGTLTVPDGLDGSRAAVLLIGGSGPTTRDGETTGHLVVRHAPFALLEQLAHLLSRQGIVVLRYDKRSCRACYPRLDFSRFRFRHLVDDARDAVAFLRSHHAVDPARIVVAGHSQGGQLAPFVAEGDRQVAGLILLGATTGTLEAGLTGQLDRLARLRRDQYDLVGWLSARARSKRHRRCFERLQNDFVPEEVCLGGDVSQQAVVEGEALATRTRQAIASATAPVLAIQGTLDRNVDPATVHELREALEGRDGEVHYVAGVGHSLALASEPQRPRIAPVVEAAIVAFLRSIPQP